jgi:protein-S-isoprenylcysteine O-methyltransferase Ste14
MSGVTTNIGSARAAAPLAPRWRRWAAEFLATAGPLALVAALADAYAPSLAVSHGQPVARAQWILITSALITTANLLLRGWQARHAPGSDGARPPA